MTRKIDVASQWRIPEFLGAPGRFAALFTIALSRAEEA